MKDPGLVSGGLVTTSEPFSAPVLSPKTSGLESGRQDGARGWGGAWRVGAMDTCDCPQGRSEVQSWYLGSEGGGGPLSPQREGGRVCIRPLPRETVNWAGPGLPPTDGRRAVSTQQNVRGGKKLSGPPPWGGLSGEGMHVTHPHPGAGAGCTHRRAQHLRAGLRNPPKACGADAAGIPDAKCLKLVAKDPGVARAFSCSSDGQRPAPFTRAR